MRRCAGAGGPGPPKQTKGEIVLSTESKHLGRRIVRLVLLGLLALAALASFLPWIETTTWWVRYLDFIRLQLVVLLVLLLALTAAVRPGFGVFGLVAVAAAALALGYHAWRLYPYLPGVPPQAMQGLSCPPGERLRVMVANVQRDNQLAQPFLDIVRQARPDLLVVLETDAWWDRQLAPLREQFSHVVQSIPDEDSYYGMHVFSRHALLDPDFAYFFGRDTPTFSGGVRLPGGETVQLYGVHPRPPQAWSQPTTARDAHMMRIALQAREAGRPVILAGDFNAVPWERVTRRALRVGQLLDPRVGRGFVPTFGTDNLLMHWPLDQILFQAPFALAEFERLPSFGSDHYPVLASLCLSRAAAAAQQAPAMQPGDLEEARDAVRAARPAQQ